MKKVLTIAGSDCSGGAGIQADLKTFSANGVFGMSVVVSVVAENTSRVLAIEDVSATMIERQIEAIFEDIEVDAVKIGMLSKPECMQAVRRGLAGKNVAHIVVDPVMYAKNGCALMEPSAIDCLKKEILPLATVITPNRLEAQAISGVAIESAEDMKRAAKVIYEMGTGIVLIKGGMGQPDALDIAFDGKTYTELRTRRIDTRNTHGTGCTLSAAIAANLAKGMAPMDAIRNAKEYVTNAIAHALPIGKGCGPTHHFYAFYED